MDRIEGFDEYRALVDVVKMHDYRYFGLNNPTVSDEEYDAMYFTLQEYEEQHADEILPDSPTQQCYSENGEHTETIEIDLKSFSIVQSRGGCNQPSEYHEEIKSLLLNNMYKLKYLTKKAA